MEYYVTYGFGNKFIRNLLQTDLFSNHNFKPKKAWWGSPINADYGWMEYCLDHNCVPYYSIERYFSDCNRIIWTLPVHSKILFINNYMDLVWCLDNKYIESDNRYTKFCPYRWNFNKLLKDGYSAIQLNNANLGHGFAKTKLESIMCTWDCESIVVLDQDKIIPCIIDKKNK